MTNPSPLLPTPGPAPAPPRAIRILAFTAVLALLYFAREVLIPITLAVILSLLIAPLVRLLRRLHLGRVPSIFIAVTAFSVLVLGLALMIGAQLVTMGGSLPQYEATIRAKAGMVREATVGRVEAMRGEAGKVIEQLGDKASIPRRAPRLSVDAPPPGVVPVEIREGRPTATQVVQRIFSSVWGPLETTGIVLVVLLFVLLEHEALRDRSIRLLGGADLRAATHAINDAGERLSRFFVSQFAVNCGVGALIWAGLLLVGLPHATLWAVLTAIMRFVPYVGVPLAGLCAGLLAAAVDPGWQLLWMTLGVYLVVETIAAQLVEPFLYGHSTGLSPLSVIIAAIFWSWLWGPVGLLVSTPLTLCLLVAGRHFKALAFLDVLLGDAPALTMSQKFYQRALSNDAEEIIVGARLYLRRKSFASYCDAVLMPAMRLAGADFLAGKISPEQEQNVRGAVVRVIEALGPEARPRFKKGKRRGGSVLDERNLGRHLRHRREDAMGRWQGPIAVPPGSIALGIGLGTWGDEFTTEILVRVLREQGVDARHLLLEDLDGDAPPGAQRESVAMVFIVSAAPSQEQERGATASASLRRRFPEATIVAVLLPEVQVEPMDLPEESPVDLIARSFEEAAEQANAHFNGEEDKPE